MRFDFYTPSEISKSLGKRLKQQRLYQNLTQFELAASVGTTGDSTTSIALRLALGQSTALLFLAQVQIPR